MRYAASVVHHSTRPNEGDEFSVTPIEADSPEEAARETAMIAAERRYGAHGSTGFVHRRGNTDLFAASIGVQEFRDGQCVTRGCSISIYVFPAD